MSGQNLSDPTATVDEDQLVHDHSRSLAEAFAYAKGQGWLKPVNNYAPTPAGVTFPLI